MEIDLDRIESWARAAQEQRKGTWVVDRLMTSDWHEPMKDGEGYAIVSSGGDVCIDGGMCTGVAHFIAQCSPDVVLELVRRVRELEAEIESRDIAAEEASEYE